MSDSGNPVSYEITGAGFGGEAVSRSCSQADAVAMPVSGLRSHAMSRRKFLGGAIAASVMVLGGGTIARSAESPSVKVGFMLSEKGPLAEEAASLMAGFELFLKERPDDKALLEVHNVDPGDKEETVLEALTSLVMKEEVRFLVGPMPPSASEKVIHGVAGANVILFVTNPAAKLVAGEMCLPASFRVGLNSFLAAQPLAAWALKSLGVKAFMTGSDDLIGNEETDFFAGAFYRCGGEFVDRIMISPNGGDVEEVLKRAIDGNADFVFASFRDDQAIEFLKTFKSMSSKLNKPLIGPECLVGYPRAAVKAGECAAGVKTLATLKDPVQFVGRIKEKLGKDITHSVRAAEGYDIAGIICHAVGEGASQGIDLARLTDIVETIRLEGSRGVLTFDKNHEPILSASIREWRPNHGVLEPVVIQELGPQHSPDLGCGRIGFPKRPEGEPEESEDRGGMDE